MPHRARILLDTSRCRARILLEARIFRETWVRRLWLRAARSKVRISLGSKRLGQRPHFANFSLTHRRAAIALSAPRNRQSGTRVGRQ
jgi:hypothetical protein